MRVDCRRQVSVAIARQQCSRDNEASVYNYSTLSENFEAMGSGHTSLFHFVDLAILTNGRTGCSSVHYQSVVFFLNVMVANDLIRPKWSYENKSFRGTSSIDT